jgi:hypothetical protein
MSTPAEDAWLARVSEQYEAERRQEEEWVLSVKTAQTAYDQAWPKHCKTCHGAGGHSWNECHDRGYPGEPMSEPCADCTEKDICARCGEQTLTEGEGPCSACGWNYDSERPDY